MMFYKKEDLKKLKSYMTTLDLYKVYKLDLEIDVLGKSVKLGDLTPDVIDSKILYYKHLKCH